MTIESYHQPESLNEAVSLLSSLDNPKILAGGTDLMTQLHRDEHIEKLRARDLKPWMAAPIQIVDISQLSELRKIELGADYCSIGAFVTHSELAQNGWVNTHLPFLATAAGQVGSPQIRNQGTVGGNICNASPCADTVPPLVCLEAEVELLSVNGKRMLPLHTFFVDAQKSVISRNEILTEIRFKVSDGETIQFFKKLGQRRGVAIAKLNLAFFAEFENKQLMNVQIAMGAVGPTVLFAGKTAEFLQGHQLSPEIIAEAKQRCSSEASPIDDIRSTREYRAAMVGELLEIGLLEEFDMIKSF